MRWQVLLSLLSLLGLALAWTKEDHEIFDLVSALEAAEGKGTNFYSFLDVEPSASVATINKAYRKKSLVMHPDKNPGVKNIQERFARLGVIAGILRSPESRERYNFFYKNGVPVWRGTGYYYSRFRPTLSHTILFLVFLTSLAHLLVMKLNYNRDAKRVAYFESNARAAAGSVREPKTSAGAPVKRRRKVRVPMVEGNEGAGVLELVVQDDQVFLPGEDGDIPLSTLATPPSVLRTWPITLGLSILRRSVALLPPNLQQQLPTSLRNLDPSSQQDVDQAGEESSSAAEDTPTPAARKAKSKISDLKRQERLNGHGKKANGSGSVRSSAAASPADSTLTTEAESEGEGEGAAEAEGASGQQEGVKEKSKKKSLGKAGAARRRKMGMK